MGRSGRGVATHQSSLRLELSQLIRMGYIKKGCTATGKLSWNTGASINVETMYTTNKEAYIKLSYIYGKGEEAQNITQTIELWRVPSNLGKGYTLYFICPITARKCRVLYMAYGAKGFYSREGYMQQWGLRIYYDTQLSSHLDRVNDRFWNYDGKIEKDKKRLRRAGYYNGKPTRRLLKLQGWEEKAVKAEFLRFMPENIPKRLRGVEF